MNQLKKGAKAFLLTTALAASIGALCWLWIAVARGQSKSETTQSARANIEQALPGLGSINRTFRDVKDSAKRTQETGESSETRHAATALADAVLRDFELDALPNQITDNVRERLIAAEVDYRTGRGGAIPETKVVRLINELANAWNAPAYARTDQREVRRMRVNLVPLMPDLASRGAAKSLVSPDMSPLEAAYISLLLIEQKTTNPSYQLNRKERESKAKQKPEKNVSLEPKSVFLEQGEREKEMAGLMVNVKKQVGGLELSEAATMIGHALDTLGVAKAKEVQR